MNPEDLHRLKEWRERGGLTEEEHERWIAGNTLLEDAGIQDAEIIHLHAMETNMALALHDFLSVLGIGQFDIDDVLGPENTVWIEAWLDEQIVPLDDMAYRSAMALFEPEGPLEDYGLLPTIIRLPGPVWDALEATEDGRFVGLRAVILDQNTRTVYVAAGVSKEALKPGYLLLAEQAEAASRAMMEVSDED